MQPLHIPSEITTLGGAIRWARRQRGWTVRTLAALVDLTIKVVQNIEYGCQGTSRVARFEDELDVELAHLPVGKAPVGRADRECTRRRDARISERPKVARRRFIRRSELLPALAVEDESGARARHDARASRRTAGSLRRLQSLPRSELETASVRLSRLRPAVRPRDSSPSSVGYSVERRASGGRGVAMNPATLFALAVVVLAGAFAVFAVLLER